MHHFGKRSLAVRATLHPVLQAWVDRVIKRRNITLLVGHRDEHKQNAAFASGASTKQWPDGKHNTLPSEAVDVAPWPIPEGWGDLKGQAAKARDLDWKERVKFYEMLASFEDAWTEMCDEDPTLAEEYDPRYGKDWDGDGDYRDQTFDDLPHIELVRKIK